MKILPLTPAQAAFVEVELIGRYAEDDDEHIAAVMETVSEHFGLTAATGTPGLAVPDAELLRRLVLDAMNGIDDAIDKGRSEQEGYGDARAARGLHKAASALYQKLKVAGFGSGLGDARDDCAAKLTALKHGDPVRIGGKDWVVWRLASDRGASRSVTAFVTRGKQTKLYKLVVKELERCVVDVCLVNGMGEVIQGPVASGPLP